MIPEQTVVINDLETRYLSGGPDDAPTVVFLHDGAWGASSDVTWGAVLPLAAERFRVVAPDLLGFGGSAKSIRCDQPPFGFRLRHVFALLDHLGVAGPVHLVGNSFGGRSRCAPSPTRPRVNGSPRSPRSAGPVARGGPRPPPSSGRSTAPRPTRAASSTCCVTTSTGSRRRWPPATAGRSRRATS